MLTTEQLKNLQVGDAILCDEKLDFGRYPLDTIGKIGQVVRIEPGKICIAYEGYKYGEHGQQYHGFNANMSCIGRCNTLVGHLDEELFEI